MAKTRAKKPKNATGVIRETVAAAALGGIVAGEPVQAIPLDEIEVLPGNPPPDPRVVEDVITHGQHEPAILLAPGKLVTPPNVELTTDPAKYLLLAGASRLQAARQANWPTLECRVRRERLHLSAAIGFALRSNTSRRAVMTAEKASRVKQLADCGLRDQEIGRVLGLDRVEVCQLRKWSVLPESWQDLVTGYETGEDRGCSWAAMKQVLAHLDIPGLIGWFNEMVFECGEPLTRARLRDALRDGLQAVTYPMDDPVFDHRSHAWRDWPDGMSADVIESLDVRELACGVDGALESRACAPWEVVDGVLLAAFDGDDFTEGTGHTEQESTLATAGDAEENEDADDEWEEPEAAQDAVESVVDLRSAPASHTKAQRDEEDADLAERFWSAAGLGPIGQRIAAATCSQVSAGSAEARQAFQLLSMCARDKDTSATLDNAHWMAVATESLFASPKGFGGQKPASMCPLKFRHGWHKPASDDYAAYFATIAKLDDPLSAWDYIELQFCRLILWPVSELQAWGLCAPDSWPRYLPWLDRSVLAAVVELFGVSIVDTWNAVRESIGTDSQAEAWFRQLCLFHDDRQLDDLAAACVDEKASSAFQSDWSRVKSRKQRVDTLLYYHRKRLLSLPRLLGEPGGKKRRKS